MGVHGLWELLAPVGRRVSVENLSGKRLAIDASIWMVQFMKAMRDENGEMVRNAHLLGFFRRICKLLFLRTKPVFVFDGATPALKRRTVLARRRQRENAQAKIRKTAERLLLNHLKEVNLKRLAEDLKNQRVDDSGKGKGVMVDGMDSNEGNMSNSNFLSASYDQEKLDEMLAASLAAEDDVTLTGEASASSARVSLEGGNNTDEEMEELVLPTMQGDVDPNVLSSLPPSMQLDLLSQMRERLMAENRQNYQKVKKAPEKFSALQIQSYLKTVAFRREIDEVQKSAGNRGVGGVRTSKIASETSREFIFSSSFAGNREALTSNRMENIIGDKEKMSSELRSSLAMVNQNLTQSKNGSGSGMNQSGDFSHENVETYLDESGRSHVSRVRALGIRMTRDLQRNLDMMKEMEHEKNYVETTGKTDSGSVSENVSSGSGLPSISLMETNSSIEPVIDHSIGGIGPSTPAENISFQILFDEDDCHDDDDEIFRGLVAGKPHIITEVGNASITKQSNASDSDIEWEEETTEGNSDSNYANEALMKMNREPISDEGKVSDEGGVYWEDGVNDVAQEVAYNSLVRPKAASRGVLEEESQLQEAIKRSLHDAQAAELENVSLKVKTKPAFSVNEVAQISPDRNEVPKFSLLKQKVQNEISASSEILDDGSQDIVGERSAVPNATAKVSATFEDQVHKYNSDLPTSDNNPIEVHCGVQGKALHDSPGFKTSNASEKEESYLGVKLVDSTVEHDSVKSAPEFSDSMDVSSAPDGVLPLQKENYMVMDIHEGPELDVNKRESLNRSVSFELDPALREDLEASLVDELSVLDKERVDLGNKQKKLERNAEAVSGEMFAECQELLQMFGLPYIIAPMEAEAQCAFLEQAGLVDGVVTDDSDVFLFGAQSVYKNIFDNRKYVETYFMKDIEHELGLSRGKLIRIAMLLGSDYTEGVSGIGIVNAIEVLNAFPEEDGLRKFREWIESPDPTIFYKERDFNVSKKGSSSRKKGVAQKKKGSAKNGNGLSCSGNALDLDESVYIDKATVVDVQELKQIFMDKHRNVSKNWHIPSSFPSDAVISAYTSPKVDLSTEPFSHGRPDHPVLRKFCLERFGWGYQKTDELLLPVLKEYNKRETQLRLEAFYTFNEKFAKIRSKRIKKAVKGITGKNSLEDSVRIDLESDSRYNSRNPEEPAGEFSIEGGSMNNVVSVGKSHKKVPRKRKICAESASTEKVNDGLDANGMHNISEAVSGIDRGRHGVPAANKSSRKQGKMPDSADICADETSKDKKPLDIFERPNKLRRSTRNREEVKYTSDVEVDDVDKPSDNFEESTAEGEQGNLVSPLHPLHPSQCADQTSFPSSISGDYLRMGGGFCIDEEEEESDES